MSVGWTCAPLSHNFKCFFCRSLSGNQLERTCAYYGLPTRAICSNIAGASFQKRLALLEPFANKLQQLYVSRVCYCVLVVCAFFRVLDLCASPSHFQVFSCRDLSENALTGTIPAQISALVKLDYLCASLLFYLVLVQVFWHFSFFSCRHLNDNDLTGRVPSQISMLTELRELYARKWNILLSVGHMLYWVLVLCASLSAFRVFCTGA